MKVYRIYAGPTGHATQIAEYLFAYDGGSHIYCEITELDAHGAPQFERRVDLVLSDNQQLIRVPKVAEVTARWTE